MMTDSEIRLRVLELALEHGNSTDKLAVASEFEAFVFARPVLGISVAALKVARLRQIKKKMRR